MRKLKAHRKISEAVDASDLIHIQANSKADVLAKWGVDEHPHDSVFLTKIDAQFNAACQVMKYVTDAALKHIHDKPDRDQFVRVSPKSQPRQRALEQDYKPGTQSVHVVERMASFSARWASLLDRVRARAGVVSVQGSSSPTTDALHFV